MPDFGELKQRASAAWSAGAFENVAVTLRDMHETLVAALDVQPGDELLDVGCGSGDLAELAAAEGAHVLGLDLSPRLVAVAEQRARMNGHHIHYGVGDAEALDVDDASFDKVVSSVGMIFAPDHDAAAREIGRVTRRGGRIAFSAWTPEGSVGELFRAMAPFQAPPPPGAGIPLAWGTEPYVREKLGGDFDLTTERRMSYWDDDSVDAAWETFSTSFGPVVVLLERLEPERRDELAAIIRAHFERALQPDGRLSDEREYLLVTGVRR